MFPLNIASWFGQEAMHTSDLNSRPITSTNIKFLILWVMGASLCMLLYFSYKRAVIEILSPLLICSITAFTLKNVNQGSFAHKNIIYLLFFSITITSFFGLTQTLTGSYTGQSSYVLYGFSFYTASLAYLLKKQGSHM